MCKFSLVIYMDVVCLMNPPKILISGMFFCQLFHQGKIDHDMLRMSLSFLRVSKNIWALCILWIGVLDWNHGVEYWSVFLEWNLGVKCWSERETFTLVVTLVSFEQTP